MMLKQECLGYWYESWTFYSILSYFSCSICYLALSCLLRSSSLTFSSSFCFFCWSKIISFCSIVGITSFICGILTSGYLFSIWNLLRFSSYNLSLYFLYAISRFYLSNSLYLSLSSSINLYFFSKFTFEYWEIAFFFWTSSFLITSISYLSISFVFRIERCSVVVPSISV